MRSTISSPVARHPEKGTDYDNLVYACVTCNGAKGDRAHPDPLGVLTRPAVRVEDDGTMCAGGRGGVAADRPARAERPESVEFRMLWIGILALSARHDPALHRRLLGYPDDLPDLTRLNPPGGNERPEGVHRSAHARRGRGELPDTY